MVQTNDSVHGYFHEFRNNRDKTCGEWNHYSKEKYKLQVKIKWHSCTSITYYGIRVLILLNREIMLI